MPVAVAQAAPGSQVMFLTYRSATSQQIWGTVFNGFGGWVNTALVGGGGGGDTNSAPAVTVTPDSALMVAVRGLDNQIYTSWSADPTDPDGGWSDFQAQGGDAIDQPTIGTNGTTGNMLLAYRGANNVVSMREYNELGVPLSGWSQDITGYQTLHPAAITVLASIFYLLITGEDTQVYWKQAWNGQ